MTKRDQVESSDIDSPIEMPSESESDQNRPSLSLWEGFCFLAVHEKKWWLVPILISLAVIAVAVAFCQLTKVPFIYRLI